jgi:hypothetical protein
MRKSMLAVFLGLVFVVTGANVSFALQSGGVEIGDLETGSVVGQPFKELDVDVTLNALENVGGKKVWYPPTSILNLRGRAGRPVVIKVTNNTSAEHGFQLSADSRFAGPTSMNVKLVLKAGETKFIGIPVSDLTYVTAAGILNYKCHLHAAHLGGQLLIQK